MSWFLLSLSSCLLMTGLIWLIQIVHYPYFRFVSEDRFVEAHHFHSNRISWIVLPIMLLELISSCFLLATAGAVIPLTTNILSFALLIGIWTSTFALQVPLHNRLGQAKDLESLQKLVVSNWLRTIGWSLRSAILLYSATTFVF